MEIGFNAGHSAIAWLHSHPESTLQSFDLCSHAYTAATAEYVRRSFPGRFSLTCGDSTKTLPAFAAANPGKTFDTIHVDGGHSAPIPLSDIRASLSMAHASTKIVIDDTDIVESDGGWSGGDVTAAVRQVIDEGLVVIVEDPPSPCNKGNVVLRLA